MKITRTAALLVGSLFMITVFAFPGLPQPANAQGTASVEGTWLETSEPPGFVGQKVTIRRKGLGEYEAFWPHAGISNIWYGCDTEIKMVITLTFEKLKKDYQGMGVPDAALREAAGVQITNYYIPSPDGRTMQFVQDSFNISWDTKSGHLISSQIGPRGSPPRILTRVSGPAPEAARGSESLKPKPSEVNTAVSGPPPQEISALQRQKEAHNLNEQGAQYYNNKQWKLAAEAFKAALEKNPDDQTIRSNYELATAHLAAEEGRKGPKRQPEAITPEVSSTSPIKQLKGTEYHGTTAKGLSAEAAKAEAMKGLDKGGSLPLAVDLSGGGKRPEWPARIKDDQVMLTLQKQQDAYNTMYQQKDKELSQVRQAMQTADPAKRAELAVKGAQIKEDMAKAEYNAALKEKEIRKRAEVLMQGSQ